MYEQLNSLNNTVHLPNLPRITCLICITAPSNRDILTIEHCVVLPEIDTSCTNKS